MLIRNANRGLEGHKLLIISPEAPPADFVTRIRAKHPGLELQHHMGDPWGEADDIDWSNITIVLTGRLLPSPEVAPKLRLVQLLTAGVNHLLHNPLFTETDIAFCTASGVHGPQIAEWVMCTFLALSHRIPRYLDNMKEGTWQRDSAEVSDAVGARVGILGYGSVGRQVGRVAKALGMDVYAYTNRPRPTPESRRHRGFTVPGTGDPDGTIPSRWFSGTGADCVDAFLSSDLDLVVLAVPLTPRTEKLISERQLRLLSGRRTFVSNIGRGSVLDTDALVRALDRGWIRGAALDVTDPEPLPPHHPLWRRENLIITPHVSGTSARYLERAFAILELNLDRLSESRRLVNQVDRERGY